MVETTKFVKSSLLYEHQTTGLALEMRSQDELDALIEALQNEEVTMVHLHNQNRSITISICLRFREGIPNA